MWPKTLEGKHCYPMTKSSVRPTEAEPQPSTVLAEAKTSRVRISELEGKPIHNVRESSPSRGSCCTSCGEGITQANKSKRAKKACVRMQIICIRRGRPLHLQYKKSLN